ncbi:hypothetical protein IG631_18572 [Alternaria alternata]|nr:hypothetical protein IG631_18572 [Alternaria alternata]
MPLLARRHRQADLLRNRDHVVRATPTSHTTSTPKPYICPLPARRLSGRTTVPSPLCSQPRVVFTGCIGSRRLPPPDQHITSTSSYGPLKYSLISKILDHTRHIP